MNRADVAASDSELDKLADLLGAIANRIGADKVVHRVAGRLTPLKSDRNVSHFRVRSVPALIRPTSVTDVQHIVTAIHSADCGIKLHPISSGRNWGLGSSLPAQDEAVILDLAELDSIRNVNLTSGWAIIEPGVTQLELSAQLKDTNRLLNVTASSGHTSVLGNALDRGVGLRRQRTADLLGAEVVLPNGEVTHVGWWPNMSEAINPYGVGPSLLHLFTQSSFGIVTAAAIGLLPRPEYQVVAKTFFANKDTIEAIDELRTWHAQELVSGVIKVYDGISTASYGSSSGQHLVLISISGSHEKVAALSSIIQRRASASGIFGTVQILDRDSIPQTDTVTRVVERLFSGDPSLNEEMLKAATGQYADNVDYQGNGWVFFLPLIPFSGEHVRRAYSLLDSISNETGTPLGSTVNALSPDVIDLVVSLRFAPDPQGIASAHQALDLAYDRFRSAGYLPYRLDIDHAAPNVTADPVSRRLTQGIKHLVDPNKVICTGRYT